MAGTEESMTDKIENIIKCALCLEVMTEPKTFTCLHSYCSTCVKSLSLEEKDTIQGYSCPQCRQFTPKSEIRAVHLMNQLLDAYKPSSGDLPEIKCDRCKTDQAQWRCVNCSKVIMFCGSCKKIHDEFHDHKFLNLEEEEHSSSIQDIPVFCEEHQKYEIEVFCAQCEITMCVMCKIFKHDGHKAEPIADALQHMVPKVEQISEKIANNIKEREKELQDLQKEKLTTESQFTKRIDILDQALESAIQRLRVDHKNKIDELTISHKADIKEADMEIEYVEDVIAGQKQAISWASTILERTTGVTLLTQLQSGVLKQIEDMASDEKSSQTKKAGVHSSRCYSWSLETIPSSQASVIKLENSGGAHLFTRVSILWNQLWVIEHNCKKVLKFDFNGDQVGTMQLEAKMNIPRVAIQLNRKYAMLAAQSGLYLITENGVIDTQIDTRDFSDVCLSTHKELFAFAHQAGAVVMFTRALDKWKATKEIILQGYQCQYSNQNYVNSFVVKDDTIHVAVVVGQRVERYNINGCKHTGNIESIKAYQFASICGVDRHNRVLIAYYGTGTLEVIEYDGTVGAVLIHGRSAWHAAFHDESTLWLLDSQKQLVRYNIT